MGIKDDARKQIIQAFEHDRKDAKRPHVKHKPGRTTLQRIIEDVEGMDLQDVLETYEPAVLAEKYHLDLSTISKWKERNGWWPKVNHQSVNESINGG